MNHTLRWGLIFCALAVVTGAFGAHSLKGILSMTALQNWETASRYQFYHGIGLVIAGFCYDSSAMQGWRWSARFFMAGIVLFSGSLYSMSLSEISGTRLVWLGPVTPIGGLCFIAGWLSPILIPKGKGQ